MTDTTNAETRYRTAWSALHRFEQIAAASSDASAVRMARDEMFAAAWAADEEGFSFNDAFAAAGISREHLSWIVRTGAPCPIGRTDLHIGATVRTDDEFGSTWWTVTDIRRSRLALKRLSGSGRGDDVDELIDVSSARVTPK